MEKVAKIISYSFQPLIMPTLGLLIFFNSNSYINYAIPKELKDAAIILVAMSTFIVPVIITLLLLNRGYISSLEMPTRKERVLPYGFTIAFYIFTIYMLKQATVPPLVVDFMVGGLSSVIFAFLINLTWKISAHMTGIGGLLGALVSTTILLEVDLISYVILTIFVSGLVASSRLILKAHTPLQLLAGFFLGLTCQVIAIYF
jgi:membrane-associated phospholipid phosphatase